jgi:mevalonate kinase
MIDRGDLPSASFPLASEAPGKAILFGEHAVVFGKTAVVLALDRSTRFILRPSKTGVTTFNGSAEVARENPYLRATLSLHPPKVPLELHMSSDLPKASGLGTSAAFTSALLAGLLSASGGASRSRLAAESYHAERTAQGLGSPVDTSAAVAGGALAVGAEPMGEPLWELPAEGNRFGWHVGALPDPGWTWVVGFTGTQKDTAQVVRRVGERVRSPDGPGILERIAEISREGITALARKDRAKVGALMGENQDELVKLGISTPRLDTLLRATRGCAIGAKITGAGGGGSILALAPEGGERRLASALEAAGGIPFIVHVARRGAHVRLPPSPSPAP